MMACTVFHQKAIFCFYFYIKIMFEITTTFDGQDMIEAGYDRKLDRDMI